MKTVLTARYTDKQRFTPVQFSGVRIKHQNKGHHKELTVELTPDNRDQFIFSSDGFLESQKTGKKVMGSTQYISSYKPHYPRPVKQTVIGLSHFIESLLDQYPVMKYTYILQERKAHHEAICAAALQSSRGHIQYLINHVLDYAITPENSALGEITATITPTVEIYRNPQRWQDTEGLRLVYQYA